MSLDTDGDGIVSIDEQKAVQDALRDADNHAMENPLSNKSRGDKHR